MGAFSRQPTKYSHLLCLSHVKKRALLATCASSKGSPFAMLLAFLGQTWPSSHEVQRANGYKSYKYKKTPFTKRWGGHPFYA